MISGLCKLFGFVFILGAVAGFVLTLAVGAKVGIEAGGSRGGVLAVFAGLYGFVASAGFVLVGAVFFALGKYLGPAPRTDFPRRSRRRRRFESV